MRARWPVWVAVAMAALVCFGFSSMINKVRDRQFAAQGEVTAVAGSSQADVVIVSTLTRGRVAKWTVNQRGDVLGWMAGDDTEVDGPQKEDCARDVCYRVAGDALRVDASSDSGLTFATAWQVDADTYSRLIQSYPDLGDPAVHLASRAVVVLETSDGGHVVFVANGRDGLLYRDPDGVWRRLGSPASGEGCCFFDPPARLPANAIDRVSVMVGVVAAVIIVGSGALTMLIRRRWRWIALLSTLPIAALTGYGAALAADFPPVGMFPGAFYGVPVILTILIVGIALTIWQVHIKPR